MTGAEKLQALATAQTAGIDLDLLDTNLARNPQSADS